jgi:CDP-glycerol glycerophosphotransferase
MNNKPKVSFKQRIIMRIKNSRILYSIYYYLGSFFISLLRIFVKPDDKLILFISYGGKRYDDSPKEISEAMLRDSRFHTYKLCWAFIDPTKHDIDSRIKKIKVDSIDYYMNAIKARVWITNVGVERALKFKGKNTLYLNTWHGTPIKKIGKDVKNSSSTFTSKYESRYDYFCVQGEYDRKVFNRAFNISEDNMILTGLPRNDVLKNYDKNLINNLKRKLDLPLDKKIILYAPTFREFNNYQLQTPIDWNKWNDTLSDEYLIILRAHHATVGSMNIEGMKNFINDFSSYSNLNDLMMISDILISDYSSIFFDYSILDKPMFCFAYDYEDYSSKRGLYFDIRNEIPGGFSSEDELITQIVKMDYESAKKSTEEFRHKYVEAYGEATRKVVDIVYSNIK